MRKKFWSAFNWKLQPSVSPLLYGNVSVHFLVCEHSQLKEEVGFECGVQQSLSEIFMIWVLTPGVNGRSDAFRAVVQQKRHEVVSRTTQLLQAAPVDSPKGEAPVTGRMGWRSRSLALTVTCVVGVAMVITMTLSLPRSRYPELWQRQACTCCRPRP